MIKLDRQDLALLKVVQSQGHCSNEALGEAVGLSTASVHRRMRRLRLEGVIEGDVMVLNGAKLGINMTMIVSIEMECESLELLNAFKARMLAMEEVQQCYYVTGEWDFILVVKVRDLPHYETFTHAAFFDHSNVKKFSTSIVMNEVKSGLSLPLDLPQ